MNNQKMIRNPITCEKKNVTEWAQQYGVPRSSMSVWLKTLSRKRVFEALMSGKRPVNRHPAPLYVNTETLGEKSMKEWSVIYGLTPRYLRFLTQKKQIPLVSKKLFAETAKEVVVKEETVSNLRVVIAKRNNAKFVENPDTKASYPIFEWARLYDVSVFEFYRTIKKMNYDYRKVFAYFDKKNRAVS